MLPSGSSTTRKAIFPVLFYSPHAAILPALKGLDHTDNLSLVYLANIDYFEYIITVRQKGTISLTVFLTSLAVDTRFFIVTIAREGIT